MRRLLAFSLSLLLLVSYATSGWTQGNPCEENIDAGNGGCGINPQAIQHQTASGGIDFSGTDYDNTCATGSGGCNVNQPILRFWEYDNFDGANSAVHPQNVSPVYWMVNPTLDFSMGSNPHVWIFAQANWANVEVQGCPTTGRTVGEVSWCDTTTGQAWYVIASVTGPAYDFDAIRGADIGPGGDDNLMPLTAVPAPQVPLEGEMEVPSPPWCSFDVTLQDPARWWTERGASASPELIAGYEILYQLAVPPGPTPGCNTGLGAWAPVLDSTASGNLGVVQAGAHTIVVPAPSLAEAVYISARVVYSDAGVGCTSAGCADPQAVGAPASCFMSVSTPVICAFTNAVTFDLTRVEWLAAGGSRVSWRTSEEYDTFGFEVQRAAAGSDEYSRVGPIVHARGPGHLYTLADPDALRSQSYDYRIVEIAFAGEPSVAGPLRLEAVSSHKRQRNPEQR